MVLHRNARITSWTEHKGGAVALAKAQGQPYENEGAGPVREADDPNETFPADRDQPSDQVRKGL